MLRQEFINAFNLALAAIAGAERITKQELLTQSRALLAALVGHGDMEATLVGDIQFINQLIPVLTPMNKKTAILFFKEFAGFHYEEETQQFTKKIEKDKVKLKDKTVRFLDDPLNNIWTWAERNVKIEKKAFDLKRVTKVIEQAREEMDGNDEAIILAILDGGLSPAAILAIMQEMVENVEPAPAIEE